MANTPYEQNLRRMAEEMAKAYTKDKTVNESIAWAQTEAAQAVISYAAEMFKAGFDMGFVAGYYDSDDINKEQIKRGLIPAPEQEAENK